MKGKRWFGPGGGRRLAGVGVAGGVELWLLLTPSVTMNDPAFEALCALSCWMPAWFCADVLSNRDPAAEPGEWTPREAGARAAARLVPCLLLLALWCGTFVARSLLAELTMPAPPFFRNLASLDELGPAWLGWTTVFLASGFAYGSAAGLCSALARRRRRWLIAPAVVVGGSLIGILAACRPGFHQSQGLFPSFAAPDSWQFWRFALTCPNYVLGSNAALPTLDWFSKHHEPLFLRFVELTSGGISMYSWAATVYFGLAGVVFSLGSAWIARKRYRQHPNTATATPARMGRRTVV